MTPFTINIKEILNITPFVMHVVCTAPKDFVCVPGQFITVLFNSDGKELRRPYSIASRNPQEIEFCIKDVDGIASRFFRTAKPGDSLECIGPLGHFHMPEGDIACIATGVGVAPFRLMIPTALKEGRTAYLLAGYRHETDILYDEEFKAYPSTQFRYTVVLSKPNTSSFKKGYVQDMLSVIPSDFKGSYLICGIYQMVKDVKQALLNAGVSKERIYTERFT